MKRIKILLIISLLLVPIINIKGSPETSSNDLAGNFGSMLFLWGGDRHDKYIETGAKTQWTGVPWSVIEPNPPVDGIHTYEFDLLDTRLDVLIDNDIVPIIEIASTGRGNLFWATNSAHPLSPPVNWEDYESFIYALASHYNEKFSGEVIYFQMGDEVYGNWVWDGTDEEYVQLLRVTYETVKSVNPDYLVGAGSLNGTALSITYILDYIEIGEDQKAINLCNERLYRYLETAGFPDGVSTIDDIYAAFNYHHFSWGMDSFFEYLLEYGYPYFDSVGFHDYGPREQIDDNYYLLMNKMQQYGYTRPILVEDSTKIIEDTSLREKHIAEEVIKRNITWASLGVKNVYWFIFHQFDDIVGIEPIIFDGQNTRPAYYAFKLLIDKVDSYTSVEKLPRNDIELYKFLVDGENIFVAWSDQSEKKISLNGYFDISEVEINYTSTQDGVTEPEYAIVPVNKIPVNSTPIFIEIPKNNAPKFINIQDQQIDEGQTIEVDISAFDREGDQLVIKADGLPAGATFIQTENNNATLSWFPTYDQAGQYQIKLSVSDPASTTDETLNIVVNDINRAPYQPSSPYPDNYASSTPRTLTLEWIGGDPDQDNVTYYVWGGTDPDNLPMIASGISQNSRYVSNLSANTTYFWQVGTLDEHGEPTYGQIWQFTTGL